MTTKDYQEAAKKLNDFHQWWLYNTPSGKEERKRVLLKAIIMINRAIDEAIRRAKAKAINLGKYPSGTAIIGESVPEIIDGKIVQNEYFHLNNIT